MWGAPIRFLWLIVTAWCNAHHHPHRSVILSAQAVFVIVVIFVEPHHHLSFPFPRTWRHLFRLYVGSRMWVDVLGSNLNESWRRSRLSVSPLLLIVGRKKVANKKKRRHLSPPPTFDHVRNSTTNRWIVPKPWNLTSVVVVEMLRSKVPRQVPNRGCSKNEMNCSRR